MLNPAQTQLAALDTAASLDTIIDATHATVQTYTDQQLKEVTFLVRQSLLTGDAPRTAEEFYQCIGHLYGYWLPYTVCEEDHVSPFEWLYRVWRGDSGWLRSLAWANRNGSKCLALDTPIPTPTGWTTQGELKVGDQVFDEQGVPCNVVAVHAIKIPRKTYEVVFSDRSVITCDDEHLWLTSDYRARASVSNTKRAAAEAAKQGRDINPKLRRHVKAVPGLRSTEQIKKTLKYGKRGDFNHSIQVCKALVLPPVDLPLDPYILGLWLGDGSKHGNVISTNDVEIVEAFADAGFEPKYKGGSDYSIRNLNQRLRKAGIRRGEKHVPSLYRRASQEQRLALVQGLMDTDGTVTTDGKCRFDNTNAHIVEGMEELLHSLGIKTRRGGRVPTFNGKACSYCHSLYFSTTVPIVRLPRKRVRLRTPGASKLSRGNRYVVDVRECSLTPVRCVTVDSASHLYLCGKAMIPTHNTLDMSMLADLMARFKPNHELIHAAGRMRQAMVAAKYLKGFAKDEVLGQGYEGKPLIFKAEFQNGSRWDIMPGTYSGVDGQHPNTFMLDEVKHVQIQAVNQCWAVAVERNDEPARSVFGSTNQSAGGAFNFLVSEASKRNIGIAKWNIVDTMQPCVNCKAVDEHPHGTDDIREQSCVLWKYCRGEKARKATGWQPLRVVQEQIIGWGGINSPDTRTQGLCLEPSSQGLVLFNFAHRLRKDEGNWTTMTYDYEHTLPFYVTLDPSEGAKAAMAFVHEYKGETFQFDELVLDSCPDDTYAKQKLFEYLREKNYADPLAIIIDPHRTDTIALFRRGTPNGQGIEHRFNAVAPLMTDAVGGQEIVAGLKELRGEICDGAGNRHFFVNPDTCPRYIFAAQNYFYRVDGDDNVQVGKTKDFCKDEADSWRYWVRYLRTAITRRSSAVGYAEV